MVPPDWCCTAWRFDSLATVPDSGTPLSSGASVAHSRKPTKPTTTTIQPTRAKLRASVFTSTGVTSWATTSAVSFLTSSISSVLR